MKSLVTAALAVALFAAAPLHAQGRTTGVMVGLHANGTTIDDDDADDGRETDRGGGVGFELGYGFSSGLVLFLAGDFASVNRELDLGDITGEERDFGLGHVDLGARVNFGGGRRALVPYLEALFTGVVLADDPDEADRSVSGGGITVGGGLQYFLTRRLAADAGVRLTAGSFTTLDLDGEEIDLDDFHVSTSRFNLGFKLYL